MDEEKNYFILTKKTTGTRTEKSGASQQQFEHDVLAGSLWFGKPSTMFDKKTYSYTLQSADRDQIILNVKRKENIIKIDERFFLLLLAISTCNQRIKIFNDKTWLQEGLTLKCGSPVVVTFSDMDDVLSVAGTLRYKGIVKGQKGILFGVELCAPISSTEKCDGTFRQFSYFECPKDCGVFVPLHRIRLALQHSSERTTIPPTLHNRSNDSTNTSRSTLSKTSDPLKVDDRVVLISNFSRPDFGTVLNVGSNVVKVHFDNGGSSDTTKNLKLLSVTLFPTSLMREVDYLRLLREQKSNGRENGKDVRSSKEESPKKSLDQNGGVNSLYEDKVDGFCAPVEIHSQSGPQALLPSETTHGKRMVTTAIKDIKVKDAKRSVKAVSVEVKDKEENATSASTIKDIKVKDAKRSVKVVSVEVNDKEEKATSASTRQSEEDSIGIVAQSFTTGHATWSRTSKNDLPRSLSSEEDPSGTVARKSSPGYTTARSRSSKDDLPGSPSSEDDPSGTVARKSTPGYTNAGLRTSKVDLPKAPSEGEEEFNKVEQKDMTVRSLEAVDPMDLGSDLEIGCLVEIKGMEDWHGVLRWVGRAVPDNEMVIAGVEMDSENDACTNGCFEGVQVFECEEKRALFINFERVLHDSRFQECRRSASQEFGTMDCPDVTGFEDPSQVTDDNIHLFVGLNRGIQGHLNSCYLDAALFSMFSFSTVFDELLTRIRVEKDREIEEVRMVLRNGIVNPLRKNFYVRADKVLKLRSLLDKLGSVEGFMGEEKDPEEFINCLLQVFRMRPFLRLSTGQSSNLYQLFVEDCSYIDLPSTQHLLNLSFKQANIKLRNMPNCLLLQTPRFGADYRKFSRVLPSSRLNMADVLEPHLCVECKSNEAHLTCIDCQSHGTDSIYYLCKNCSDWKHNEDEYRDHQLESLEMALFAVLCIEKSHYVAFVKCGSPSSDAPWVFFNSMADRKGDAWGYNLPEVALCPEINDLLSRSEKSEEIQKEIRFLSDKELPEYTRRLVCDAYICMYAKL